MARNSSLASARSGGLFLVMVGGGITPNLIWNIIVVDATGGAGWYAAMAFEPATGLPHIAYWNSVGNGVFLAHPVSAGGNCAPGNTWLCDPVAGTSHEGAHTTLAFAPTCKRGIVFYNASLNRNRFNERNTCLSNFTSHFIDSTITSTMGIYNSLKFDPLGTAHLAYARGPVGAGQLKYARHVGDNNGNCGSTNAWDCSLIESGSFVGQFASLGVTFGGSPRIAYKGAGGTLRFARSLGNTSGNCGTSNTWQCDTIDAAPGLGTGFKASLYVPQCLICGTGDHTRIAYYNYYSHTLLYAETVAGNSGNCGFGTQQNDWQCDVIETVGDGTPRGVSLAVVNSSPVIAYQDSDDQDHNILKIARPSNVPGNCGPVNLFYTWQCDVVDDGQRADGAHWVGRYVSLAGSPNGRLYVAYHDTSDGVLLLAYQAYPLYMPLIKR